MKRATYLAVVVSMLAILTSWQPAFGKAATVLITVSGGDLRRAFAVMEPDVLNRSNVWLGSFLDSSTAPVSERPRGLRAYQISFYVGFQGHDPRLRYVVYYYPRSRERGYIYLPGYGDKDYDLNSGSIIRPGLDGKLRYADPRWEALIKPLIANAEAR